MAKLGNIYLGGSECDQKTNMQFRSGVGFFLNSKSGISEIFRYDNDNWEIEIAQGQTSVVARYKEILTIEEILKIGFEYCQKSLDIISVTLNTQMHIKDAGSSHVLLYFNNEDFVIREVSICDFPILFFGMGAVIDKNGKIIDNQPKPKVAWNPAYRFYRLSQQSSDLFEAYRNIYLGFESMLSEICPKGRESESEWLKRALNKVSESVDFNDCLLVKQTNPVQYFIDSQYKKIRCNLFHAKDGESILPHENLNPTSVSDAYKELISIFKHIMTRCYNVNQSGGGVTNAGFENMIKATFNGGFVFNVTEDSTELSKGDVSISPLGKQVFTCEESFIEYGTGKTLLIGKFNKEIIEKIQHIYRIGIFVNDELIFLAFVQDGLNVMGVNKLEHYQTLRLVNKNQPNLFS